MFKHFIYQVAVLSIFLSSCTNSTVWEETKTASRYLNKKGMALFKQDKDSKIVHNRSEFYDLSDDEYIPLKDQEAKTHLIETTNLQPKDLGSLQNGLKLTHFKTPESGLAAIFKNVYFNTDDDKLRSKEYFQTIERIAYFLKDHTELYLFVAGHCDERASDAYNEALGAKRANFVRNLLIKEGIDPDRIYSISYGKKQPLVEGHNKTAWGKNRRVEFKIFDKTAQY